MLDSIKIESSKHIHQNTTIWDKVKTHFCHSDNSQRYILQSIAIKCHLSLSLIICCLRQPKQFRMIIRFASLIINCLFLTILSISLDPLPAATRMITSYHRIRFALLLITWWIRFAHSSLTMWTRMAACRAMDLISELWPFSILCVDNNWCMETWPWWRRCAFRSWSEWSIRIKSRKHALGAKKRKNFEDLPDLNPHTQHTPISIGITLDITQYYCS